MEIEEKINALLDESYSVRTNNLEQSIELVNNALALCKEKVHDQLKAKAFSRLSLYYMITARYDESFNFSQKSIHLYEKFGDERGVADVKYSLGGFYYKTNDFQMGVVCLIDALIIYKKYNDYHNISRCEKTLGTIYDFTGDQQKAIQSNRNAIKAAKKAGDSDLESNANINLSGIYLNNNNIDLAEEIIQNAIKVKRATGDTRGLAFAIYGRAKVHLAQKKYPEAETDFFEAMTIHSKMGEKMGLAMAYNKLAKLYFETGKIDLAKKYCTTGLELCEFYTISMMKIKLLHFFYTIYKSENNLEETLKYLELYLAEKERMLNAQNFKIIENYDLLVRMQAMQKDAEHQQERSKLIAKNNKIEQVARVRQEFLSTMSHEIRTPLNAVTTIAAMLSESPHIEDKTLIDSLKFSSNHLMQIINDILDYTRLDLGKTRLDEQVNNIKTFAANFCNTYQIQAESKGIELALSIAADVEEQYYFDETKITQILGNLVNNALKFTEEGSITIDIGVLDKYTDTDRLLFKVSDTGIGIERENMERIFDSFSQLKNGITRKKDGAGLGLSIIKKLIELHESEIKIESVFGKGSVFSFELILRKSQDTNSEILPAAPDDIEGRKVLLAEDNAINALIAIKLLSKWGIETDHAKNGLEATEKSQLNKYDFILMDIHMPVLDGYEAAKNIRTLDNLNTETPIFGLTADISAKDNENYSSYFNGFLLKPLEIEKLKATLSSK